ncbi:MAG TPA: dihydropteroate synthase [Pyrinomonadaceae bacterium]
MTRDWRIAGQAVPIGTRTLIMAVLNVTPDSFSDGNEFLDRDKAIAHAEQMVAEGADLIDVGGESTRPGAKPVESEDEIRRIIPVIEQLAKRTSVPISVDTTKSLVASAALRAGAQIINDVSALRFDPEIADVAAGTGAGLVLMHSRGGPATMHSLPAVHDIVEEVTISLGTSIDVALRRGVKKSSIVIDPGIGFGKTQEQNLELIAKLYLIAEALPDFPILVGTSRKSFIGKILNGAAADERLHGTMASVAIAVLNGADIVRVHDVKAAVETVRTVEAIRSAGR